MYLVGARATSRKVVGSIPDGVIGVFYCLNPSGGSNSPSGSTAPNRSKYQGWRLVRMADNVTT